MAHPGGRPRKIESPEALEALFEEYKQWAEDNPWYKQDFVKSGEMAGSLVDLKIERPLTEVEFASFCGMSISGLQEYCKREEFSGIYARIKTDMMANRISGGLVGTYNASLVARIDGLVEKTESKIDISPVDQNAVDELQQKILRELQ